MLLGVVFGLIPLINATGQLAKTQSRPAADTAISVVEDRYKFLFTPIKDESKITVTECRQALTQLCNEAGKFADVLVSAGDTSYLDSKVFVGMNWPPGTAMTKPHVKSLMMALSKASQAGLREQGFRAAVVERDRIVLRIYIAKLEIVPLPIDNSAEYGIEIEGEMFPQQIMDGRLQLESIIQAEWWLAHHTALYLPVGTYSFGQKAMMHLTVCEEHVKLHSDDLKRVLDALKKWVNHPGPRRQCAMVLKIRSAISSSLLGELKLGEGPNDAR